MFKCDVTHTLYTWITWCWNMFICPHMFMCQHIRSHWPIHIWLYIMAMEKQMVSPYMTSYIFVSYLCFICYIRNLNDTDNGALYSRMYNPIFRMLQYIWDGIHSWRPPASLRSYGGLGKMKGISSTTAMYNSTISNVANAISYC